MFYTGLAALFPLALPLGGMAGALAAAVLIQTLAGRNSSVLMLILAGIAVNAMAGALIALVLNLAPSPYAALEIFFWLLGSLADRSFTHVMLALPLMAVGWALMAGQGRALDALSIGEETAASLGVNIVALRARLIAGIALSVGAAVAVSGVVGFVGLVVPHLLRPLVGHQPSHLLLPSALGGAALTLAADSALRMWWSGPELRLGVVTALIGAPFFFALLLRTRQALT
jgi:iron complex transport system permease protein